MIRPSAPRAPHSLAIPSPSIPSIPKVHHSSHSFPSLSPRKRVLARPLVRRERSLDRDVYTSQIHQSRLPDESIVNPETTAHRRDDSVESGGFRLGNRIGLAKGKNVLEVENNYLKIIPNWAMKDAHHWLILHGRYVCKARNPECNVCKIKEFCEFFKKEIYYG